MRAPLFAPPLKISLVAHVFRVVLGLFMLYAGISHLTFAREEFTAQVPHILPFPTDFTVVASGVVEILLGAAFAFVARIRIPVGLTLAAFFVAVFPGNIAQWLNHADGFGLDTDGKRLARLFFQPVLIAWALTSSGAWKWIRGR